MTDTRFIFLVGAARSGTKFLRDTLAASSQIAEVPYDINYVWRHGNESAVHDELKPGDIDDKTAAYIRKSIVKLATKGHGGLPKLILEKTVANTLRMEMVRRVFPEAEFIYLERSGFDVVESSYRQWTMPPDRAYLIQKLRYFPIQEWRYALWFAKNTLAKAESDPIWGPRYDGIEQDLSSRGTAETCALQWKRSVETARSSLRPIDTFSVRYEELANGESGLAQLLAELEITDVEAVLNSFETRFRRVETWPGAVPVTERAAVHAIISSVASTS